jgi:hypothetical protein
VFVVVAVTTIDCQDRDHGERERRKGGRSSRSLSCGESSRSRGGGGVGGGSSNGGSSGMRRGGDNVVDSDYCLHFSRHRRHRQHHRRLSREKDSSRNNS